MKEYRKAKSSKLVLLKLTQLQVNFDFDGQKTICKLTID